MIGNKVDVVAVVTVAADMDEAAVEAVAVVLAVVSATAVVSGHPDIKTKAPVRIPLITHLQIGINYLLKSATRFVKSVIEKANRAVPSERSATYPSNNSRR